MRIFIVEDDANLLAGLLAKFRTLNFPVETNNGTTSVEEILNRAKEFEPDIIILDLMLPKVNGFDILSRLREKSEDFHAVTFVFTNLSDTDSKERCSELGADHYFIKDDFSIDAFIEKIAKIMTNRAKIAARK